MFFTILFWLMSAMDLIWWLRADLRLRRLPRSGKWRVLLLLFMGSLAACMLCFAYAPSLVRRAHGVLPLPLHAMVYVWHLLILPITFALMILSDTGRVSLWLRGFPAGSPGRSRRSLLAQPAHLPSHRRSPRPGGRSRAGNCWAPPPPPSRPWRRRR